MLRANGSVSEISIYGMSLETETPVRMPIGSLQGSYVFKVEFRDLLVPGSCREGLLRALAALHLEHGGKQEADLRVVLELTGRRGEHVVLVIDQHSRVIIDDEWVGDGAPLVQWMRAGLGSCITI